MSLPLIILYNNIVASWGIVKENDPIRESKEESVEIHDDKDGKVNNEIEEVDVDFVLTNENGKVLLDVKTNKIICFEANDNYAVTYYINDKDEVKKSMERISLKKIIEEYTDL